MNKKYLIFLFLIILGIGLFASHYNTVNATLLPNQWQAEVDGLTAYDAPEGENWFTKAIQNGVFYILINAGKGLLFLAQNLLDYVMSDNFINTGFIDNEIVKEGLKITKNLGNIIIILASVIIALATILRVKEYQAQKTIPILIFVALLINFAPMICGVIIDGSNITMNYFRDAGGLSPSLQQGIDSGMNDMMKGTLTGQQRFGQGIALTVFALFTSIIFLLYATLFAFRYIALWLLIIFSPLAFACYILKFTRKFFTQWWNQFLQWSIIGIPAMFILFLTNIMLTAIKKQTLTSVAPQAGLTGFTVIFQYFMPVIFLIGGFFMTLQTGAAGANIVTGFFDKQVRAGGALAWKGVKKGVGAGVEKGSRKIRGGAGKDIEDAMSPLGDKQQESKLKRFGMFTPRLLAWTIKKTGVGRALMAGADEADRKGIKDKQKETEGTSLSYQGKTMKSVKVLDRIAGLLAAIKDKNVKDLIEQRLIDKKQIKKIMKDAMRTYPSAMGEMKKAISPRLVEEAVNEMGGIPELDAKKAGVHLSKDDIEKRGWTLKDKLYATARAKNIEEWDSDTLEEYANSTPAHLSASTQQFAAAARTGGPQFMDIYNKKGIKMAMEAGYITRDMSEKAKKDGLRKFYKDNNGSLGAYRDNTAAERLGAGIKTIDISKLEEDIGEETGERTEVGGATKETIDKITRITQTANQAEAELKKLGEAVNRRASTGNKRKAKNAINAANKANNSIGTIAKEISAYKKILGEIKSEEEIIKLDGAIKRMEKVVETAKDKMKTIDKTTKETQGP